MERFPVERMEVEPYEKVGAVLVLPNDRLYAVDCSRNGVHAVVRLLMKHPKILEGCKVYVSRKPCSFCTKLLVQSKVKRVFYLPIEPEYIYMKSKDPEKFKNETERVDNLFKVSEIGQSVFVPKVGEGVLASAEERQPTLKEKREEKTMQLFKTYWKDDGWMAKARDELPWPAFNDDMKTEVRNDFRDTMEWIARIQIMGSEKRFRALHRDGDMPFDPEAESNHLQCHQAEHLINLAKILAERTDDPKTGVGAVIINDKREIVGLGWNGFPTKALYGEFPRASDKDVAVRDKKYPYVIHAEQNALLMRNINDIAGGTLFVTKTPCDECTPLIQMVGIKTVVLGVKLQKERKEGIVYSKFEEKVNTERAFVCFEMESAESEMEDARASGIQPAAEKEKASDSGQDKAVAKKAKSERRPSGDSGL